MTNDISSYVQDQIESISYNYENHESYRGMYKSLNIGIGAETLGIV